MLEFKFAESSYSKRIPIEHRKKYAQYFTPPLVAEFMTKWLLGNNNVKTVLEPAFGLGIFSRFLLSQKEYLQIRGYDTDAVVLNEAKALFDGQVKLLNSDYLFSDWYSKYDGIICNPPYFKFHDYNNKEAISEVEHHLGLELSGFTNLYTLFLLKSLFQLSKNGRCAYIVPSEFLNSDYGIQVKEYLKKTGTLRYVIVFDFKENVFDDALTTTCVILCANDQLVDFVQFIKIQSVSEISSVLENYPKATGEANVVAFENLNPEIKWRKYYTAEDVCPFKNLVPFSEYAKAVRGIATGANNYFAFNISKARKYGIKESNLLPCICRCADINGSVFTKDEYEKLKLQDKNVFLFNGMGGKSEAVENYLQKGETEGVDKKYLTASRTPWYMLENRLPSPIWVSVFSRSNLRFVYNKARVSNLTTFHCIYPQKNLFQNVPTEFLFAYLLTDTAKKIFYENRREYGNGLVKFEPNDLNNAKMLDIRLLPEFYKKDIVGYLERYQEGYEEAKEKIEEIFVDFFSKI